MPSSSIQFSVFARPWRMAPPESVRRGLPEAVRILGEDGPKVFSGAAPADGAAIAACAG